MGTKPILSLALALFTTLLANAQLAPESKASDDGTKILLTSDVKWQQLNPLRGDKSPKAGTLWGDRTGPGPAGFLLKPIDGFRSPPHIHNIAYRGVVISGLIHNDDPDAEDMWLPTGSFWTQPAGGVHITAAKGADTLAYIEVEDGFGVLPAKQAFDDKDEPVNVAPSNIVWLDASNTNWVKQSGTPAAANAPEIAFLWGTPRDGQLNGTLVKLPAGSAGTIQSQGTQLRAVVIQGHPMHNGDDAKAMEPGSYFSSKGTSAHRLSCKAGVDCILYVRMEGRFVLTPG